MQSFSVLLVLLLLSPLVIGRFVFKEPVERLFEEYQHRYGRFYQTHEERMKRLELFRKNLFKIEDLNRHEEGTATYGITKFTDLSEEEFKRCLRHPGSRPFIKLEEPQDFSSGPLPDSFDWRTKGVVTGIKDQGQCGSCWAFSAVANIEGQWAIKKKQLISLSEQELVDCDKIDKGCEGGLQPNAYKEIMRLGGLMAEEDYPYTAKDGPICKFDKSKVKVYINGSLELPHNESAMQAWLVKNGPIAIAMNANAMQFYEGGVSKPLSFLCPGDQLDHGVLLVGYGVHNYPLFNVTLPFWIIKNSWGENWGEQGYYRLYRGTGLCGVDQLPTSAKIF